MDSLDAAVALPSCMVALVILLTCWESSGKWMKQKPWAPFALGIVMLVVCSYGYLLLYQSFKGGSENVICLKDKVGCSADVPFSDKEREMRVELLQKLANGAELQLKVFELILIPFAVFYCAFAIQNKSENSLINHHRNLARRMRFIDRYSQDIETKQSNLISLLNSDSRGKEIVEIKKEVDKLKFNIIYYRSEIRSEFRDIVDSQL